LSVKIPNGFYTAFSFRIDTHNCTLTYRKKAIINLELATTSNKDIDFLVQSVLVIERHGLFGGELVENASKSDKVPNIDLCKNVVPHAPLPAR
jgi:hypothetical protein